MFLLFFNTSLHPPICLNICSFLRVYIQPAHVCISSGSKWERNREMEGDGVQERKMERERWPLVLSKREMSRCGKATERKTDYCCLQWRFGASDWRVRSSYLQPSPPLCSLYFAVTIWGATIATQTQSRLRLISITSIGLHFYNLSSRRLYKSH